MFFFCDDFGLTDCFARRLFSCCSFSLCDKKQLFLFQIEKYVSSSKLKYYFAVDTAYVGKKLGLLIFPFAHSVNC